VIQLDRDAEAAVVRAAPEGALDVDRPVLLDEWQVAPELLGAVKGETRGRRQTRAWRVPHHRVRSLGP
jgi:hypothetical protein